MADRERVLLYLYNEMCEADRAGFERDLETHPALKEALLAEQRFQALYPTGIDTHIPDETLLESQVLLRHALRKLEHREGYLSGLGSFLVRCTGSPVAGSFAFVAVFVLGLLAHEIPLSLIPSPSVSAVEEVQLPNPESLDILDLQVTNYNPSTGDLNIQVDAVSRFSYHENIGNHSARILLSAALKSNLEPGARLDAIDMLRDQTESGDVRQVLIYVLLYDENPGVRLHALDVLKDLTSDSHVREALLLALSRDQFPGVRMDAIEALEGYGDPEEVAMVGRSKEDVNYIHGETRRTLENWNSILRE